MEDPGFEDPNEPLSDSGRAMQIVTRANQLSDGRFSAEEYAVARAQLAQLDPHDPKFFTDWLERTFRLSEEFRKKGT